MLHKICYHRKRYLCVAPFSSPSIPSNKKKKINNCLDARTHVSYIMLNIYIENNIMLNMMLHKRHTFI